MNFTPEEIDNIAKLPPKYRYLYSIHKIANTQEFWTLIDSDGAFALFEVENTIVISLWCDETFIESNLTPDWTEYIPFKLSIDTLQDILIPLVRQNNYLINVFPVDSRVGHLISLHDFVQDLNNEIETII